LTKKINTRTRLDSLTIKRLIKSALAARKHSYAPYTGIKVGAALLAGSGKIYSGTNIESIVPDSTICAERNAIYKAISEGEKGFAAISVLAFNDKPIYPCGTCRQVLSEHGRKMIVILSDLKGRYSIARLSDLLPKAYA
jgi:cytidine deaminase